MKFILKIIFLLLLLAISSGFAFTDAFADHSEVTIVPVTGSGAPGCESSGCYSPSTVSVDVGGKVIMSNTDSAAHTYTAGTPGDGPSGEFDTGMLMAGNSFEWSPDTVGEIPYFCLLHPWMEGLIIVSGSSNTTPAPTPTPTPTYPSSAPYGTDVTISRDSGAPGCERSNSCYSPYRITVDGGETISWYNADSAAHTVTAGTPGDGPSGNFDSGLFMAGGTFSVTLDESGEYPYFCMVHPWMLGNISVN